MKNCGIKFKLLILFVLQSIFLQAQLTPSQVDELVSKTIRAFDVPGISVGILKDGKLVYAKGIGVRSLSNNLPMNEKTLVGIASNSKGFTCFSIALLVDEGKLKWDDKVTKYIPDFQLYDAYVSKEITIRDLCTHRSGLGLGGGDLMFFPEGGSFSTQDIIHNLRYIKQHASFRNTLEYNNNAFVVAGEIIRRVSGLTWEEFVETRILKPVGMLSSVASYNRVKDHSNIIDAHAPVDGKVVAVPHDWNPVANPAGGIMSNIEDMAQWAQFLLDGGVTKNGKRLISEKQMNELWNLQMPVPVPSKNSYDMRFNGYALGWFVNDVKGHKQVSHTGGLIGTVTQFTLIPDLKLGIIVLTNQQSGAAFSAITNTIKDAYLGYDTREWVDIYKKHTDAMSAEADSIMKSVYGKVDKEIKNPSCKVDISGTYNDKWFGNIYIKKQGDVYNISCEKSPRLFGSLLPYDEKTWVAKWNDRSYDADAFVKFIFDGSGNPQGFTMEAISPNTDFSFDFQDLELRKVK